MTEPVSLALARHLRWLKNLPQGWHGLFTNLAKRLARDHPDVQITHAGQKLAMLQVLTRGGSGGAHELLMEVWQKSAAICEECGAEGRLLVDSGGWYRTLCPRHADGFRTPPRRRR